MSWIWCDGDFIDGPLALSPADRGLCHGLGLFETLLAVDGRPRALELHLARLREGARLLRWDEGWMTEETVGEAIRGLLLRRNLTTGRARVRVAVTAGSGDLRSLEQGKDARRWITAEVAAAPPASMTLTTAPFPRDAASPLAGIKCASYAANLLALDHARRAGADEALMLDHRGHLSEAATANVFVVEGGRVLTPPLSAGCLPGTMRARVLAKCGELGIPAAELDLTRERALAAGEMFLTSATRGVVPVAALDGLLLEKCPGAITARLRDAFA